MLSEYNRRDMRKSSIIHSLLMVCIMVTLVIGCTSTKDMGTVHPPTIVHGTGPAIIKFNAVNPSYSFHVISTGDRAGMIVTIGGERKNRKGEIQYDTLAHDVYAEKGIDVESSLKGFTQQIYTIEVMTINDKAPWSIEIT